MITDVKLIPFSIKIIFFRGPGTYHDDRDAWPYDLIFFDAAASSAGPARALLRSDAVRVGLYFQGGSIGPLSGNRDGRRRRWT